MRGGPRLMCSPYLTGSLGIMLCLVTFNYWTVSTQNSDLVKKVEEMQQQLQLGSKHIQSLEEETREIRKQMKKYKDMNKEERVLKEEVENKFKDMVKDRDETKKKLEVMTELKTEADSDADEQEKKLAEDKEMEEKAMDSLRDELEEMKEKLHSAQGNLTTCQAELASDRADQLLVPPGGAAMAPRHLGRNNSLGPGQLPDINPGAVSVIKKETQGMVFHKDKTGHWLPILPPGNPKMPRAKPSVSVMDLAQSKRVKKHALVGAGLSIVDNAVKMMDNVVNKSSVSPSPEAVAVRNLSSSRKPVSPSPGGLLGVLQQGVAPAPKIVVNEAGVMPLPNVIKTGDVKAGFENLDNAEDDSQIAQHENGPEGKEEIQDDDQNPDGQIDETVDLDKQHYLVDKAAEETGGAGEGAEVDKTKEEIETSLEDGGVDDNLDNLKESLNKIEQ
eukprot:GFUD01012455.1.p1 GENE.GFUD01012455.1~~GFUD01012455.1.p1  ORF type:complete len:445 (-),score=187.41 GFUD01012455.1:228-1562(-)